MPQAGRDDNRPAGLQTWMRRARFGVSQGARMAWYGAHGEAMKRIAARTARTLPGEPPRIRQPETPPPSQHRMLADIARLLARDLANVEAGLYPMPAPMPFDEPGGFASLLRRSARFLRDVPEVTRRRREEAHQEASAKDRALPRYYQQNFHFQTDGWLSDDSAEIYDFQVEVLFTGAAAAMRRQALVPLAEMMRARDQRNLAYADIACGTGGLLRDVTRAWPRLPALGIDLSEPYLRRARANVPSRRARFAVAQAEDLPLTDASLDAASSVYLFHELPPKVRRQVAAEIARVLKPGGLFILTDSLQTGDDPDYDGLLEIFPQLFHEPYYTSYLTEDFDALFAEHGLTREDSRTAFVSKVSVFRKG
ncbi:class I SAM-dependent methyltransferase [Breoghania sp. L-A4]|uniref:class I SAM-dependent methyltransferase n=1 Tax=Breoghania sp. L-A4 TaxID=2304600 RepID=UPI000E35B888|nr:class I SAM-dependent methyltransferase [Breoghania sp. L-A4]AXS39585.1 class I SAM-dependent methyltransferase [Breoghania sp. L-A4]